MKNSEQTSRDLAAVLRAAADAVEHSKGHPIFDIGIEYVPSDAQSRVQIDVDVPMTNGVSQAVGTLWEEE